MTTGCVSLEFFKLNVVEKVLRLLNKKTEFVIMKMLFSRLLFYAESFRYFKRNPAEGKRRRKMIKLQKKQVKIISVLIALVFMGSVVALALSQSGSGIASAASSSNVGVIDYRQFSQLPDVASIETQMQQASTDAQKEFNEKSANMSDQEKAAYYQQTMQRLQQQRQDLLDPVQKKIEDAVKSVAEAKGLSVVLVKDSVIYGGQDITQDVVKKLSK